MGKPRLGRRERLALRAAWDSLRTGHAAIVNANLHAPKPEAPRAVIRTKGGSLLVVADRNGSHWNPDNLKAKAYYGYRNPRPASPGPDKVAHTQRFAGKKAFELSKSDDAAPSIGSTKPREGAPQPKPRKRSRKVRA